ncbi:MAG: peptidylprolyl isomerase [candidate division NC10 bacterium]|nr:peptidylprolyl isomerase [candidate division NC10 bacterium]
MIPFLALIPLVGCGRGDGKVLAKVNQTQITAADLRKEIDQLPFHSRAALMSGEGQERLLEEMIKRELLLQEAERRKLDSQPELKARLEESRRGILLNALLAQEILDKVQVTGPEVRAYFDKHRDELETAEVHLKQILLKDSKEAEEIHARLLKDEEFEKLARQFSADKLSASKGGDLGFVSRGQMVPELERAAFSLKPQEISRIIKTDKGYHILKLVGRRKTITLNYEEVRDRLQPYALAEKQRERLESWIQELRSRSRVKTYSSRLPVSLSPQNQMSTQGPPGPPPKKPPVPSQPPSSPGK